MVPYIEVT